MSRENKDTKDESFQSLIDVYEARRLLADAISGYEEVVNIIKDAANNGKVGVYVPNNLISYKISRRLTKDGFDTSADANEVWIYWGTN